MSTRTTSSSPLRFGRILLVPALLLALLVGCSSLAGRQSGGRYTAPDGLFSLPVPELGLGATIEDEVSTDPQTKQKAGMVYFHDDMGGLRVVRYEQISPEAARALADASFAAGALRSSLHDVILAEILQELPRTRVVREESVTLSDGLTAWFGVLEIPEGSPMMVMNAEHPQGRRLDSTRAFLQLCRPDGLFLSLSAANDDVLGRLLSGSEEQEGVSQAGMEELKDLLVRLYASMRFG